MQCQRDWSRCSTDAKGSAHCLCLASSDQHRNPICSNRERTISYRVVNRQVQSVHTGMRSCAHRVWPRTTQGSFYQANTQVTKETPENADGPSELLSGCAVQKSGTYVDIRCAESSIPQHNQSLQARYQVWFVHLPRLIIQKTSRLHHTGSLNTETRLPTTHWCKS